eukprot:CAMPEP_0172189934 /NCGR_PEP_ID=MMETSP1050-20130122/22817_1 /TAXON_ID=233186 /ORGANISM="Cryptomonas curvata, Strain CCAP979/52" /LENGTH=851 /DNA_ID=CAMNT_0012864719 /DNA_START=252 /DNA_END=2806 /DNA_ORIENTATION=-
MDSAVVAPKKKFLAAQAEAAASDSASSKGPPPSPGGVLGNVGAALSEGRATEARPVLTSSHATSYSTRDNAPAGARSADDDENVRFQNSQLYAANQAHRNEIGRLTKQIDSLQSQHQNCAESVACIQRHWLMLTDELKRTFQRLERTKSTMDHTIVNDTLQAFFQNQIVSASELDSKLTSCCVLTQELMQEVVQAFMDCDARQKSILATEGKDMNSAAKIEIDLLLKRNTDLERSMSEIQDQIRSKSAQEISQTGEIARLMASNEAIQQEMTELRSQLELAERRLVRSEENFRKLSAGGSSAGGTEGADMENSDGLDLRPADYRLLAETRLEEIREKNKRILQLESMSLTPASEAAEPSEQAILQSSAYTNLVEQLSRSRKECEYHVHRLQLVTAELAEVKERIFDERQKLEQLHNSHIKEQLGRLSLLSNQLLEAKQEIRSLQFKLEQKSACDIASKRADELSENLTKLQEEYKRLRAEYELLKQKPDADELRREFREREEKIAKERDVRQIEANDYLDQIRMQERKIAMLMGRNGESGAHGSNGVDSSAQREIDALKKDLEALRNERKDLQRRFLKADRGFNDCNKLYQQVKKEKDALMKDLESLGLSFEDMQEQNVRLLQQMKTKDEEQNELLKQRMKDKTLRETMTIEIASLKLKLEKSEEVLRVREDCVDKCKIDMEQQRQEFLKKKKEEECEAAAIAAHRLSLQKKEQAAIEAKREADKARSEMNEQQKKKRENLQTLQDVQFENNRLLEELATLKSRLQTQATDKKASAVSADHMQLLDHYRSRVKCHCRQDDKSRVFPCGHATCIKCCDNLIKERSRKCPACSRKFDQSEIRPLFLQGSSDEG